MNTVYVVTAETQYRGYTSTHVAGVYTTKKAANEAVKVVWASDGDIINTDVEALVVDDEPEV